MSLPIAYRLVKPVPLLFAGESWPLLITYGVLLDCEAETGEDMLGSASALLMPSGFVLRALLWACLRNAGAEFSLSQVGARMRYPDLPGLHWTLVRAFFASMPEPKKEKKKPGKEAKREERRGWIELWSEAHGLGLSAEEFLELVPRQFEGLREMQLREWQREELLFSGLRASIVNYSTCRPVHPVKDDAFMLHKFPEQPLTAEVIRAKLKAALAQ